MKTCSQFTIERQLSALSVKCPHEQETVLLEGFSYLFDLQGNFKKMI